MRNFILAIVIAGAFPCLTFAEYISNYPGSIGIIVLTETCSDSKPRRDLFRVLRLFVCQTGKRRA